MSFEEAGKIVKDEGLAWEVVNIVSESHYHFIKCRHKGKGYTVVYNDKMEKIVKLTMEG